MKVDCDEFGVWVPPDERLGQVVLGLLRHCLGPVHIELFLVPAEENPKDPSYSYQPSRSMYSTKGKPRPALRMKT